MRKLSGKQKRFINEYLIDTNATQAAIRAGYSQKSARYAARDLLARQQIKNEIQDRLAILDKAKVCTIQEVMEYLTAVMRGETTSTVIMVVGRGGGVTEAQYIEKPPSMVERLRAAELLGKRYGLFNNTFEIESAIPVVIVGSSELDDSNTVFNNYLPGACTDNAERSKNNGKG